MNRAIFFDRDGTLNNEVGYLWQIDKFHWLEGAKETIKLCNEKNYLVIIITNQGGVARGLYTEDDIKILHDFMQEDLKKIGAHIDGFYYCPHHPEGKVKKYSIVCDCRKPKPGLFHRAAKDFNIDLKNSVMIGDMERDIESGKNAGVGKNIFFDNGDIFGTVKKVMDW